MKSKPATPTKTLWSKFSSSATFEVQDEEPVFFTEKITWRDWKKLFLRNPTKFFIYRHVVRTLKNEIKKREKVKALFVNSGTGGMIIDCKKLFGRTLEVTALDDTFLQRDLMVQKIKHHGVWAQTHFFEETNFPLLENCSDFIYAERSCNGSTKLPEFFLELRRVLVSDGEFVVRVKLTNDADAKLSRAEIKGILQGARFLNIKIYTLKKTNSFSKIWCSFFPHFGRGEEYVVMGTKVT